MAHRFFDVLFISYPVEVPMRRGFPVNRPRALARFALLCALTTLPACSIIDAIQARGADPEDMSAVNMDMSAEDMSMPADMAGDMTAPQDMSVDMPADMPAQDMTPGDMDVPTDMLADAGMDMSADMADMAGPACGGEDDPQPTLLMPGRKISARRYVDDNNATQRVVVLGKDGPEGSEDYISVYEGGNGAVQVQPGPRIENATTELNATVSFGVSVAISPDGQTLAVGAPADGDEGTPGAGRVYILERSQIPDNWVHVQTLAPTVRNSGDNFGFDLAYTADPNGNETLVVGAPLTNAEFQNSQGVTEYVNNAGAVHIFIRDAGATFAQVKAMRLPFLEKGTAGIEGAEPFRTSDTGRFGYSVDASGSWHRNNLTVIVGAPTHDTTFVGECTYPNAGSAYLLMFQKSSPGPATREDFQLAQYLLPDEGGDGFLDPEVGLTPGFGADVAIAGTMWRDDMGQLHGNIAYLIAAPEARDGAGEVYFGMNGESDRPYIAKLRDNLLDGAALPLMSGDHFGDSVDITGSVDCGVLCVEPDSATLYIGVGARDRLAPDAGASGAVYGFGMFIDGSTPVEADSKWQQLGTDGQGALRGGYHEGLAGGFGQGVVLLRGEMQEDAPSLLVSSDRSIPQEVTLER